MAHKRPTISAQRCSLKCLILLSGIKKLVLTIDIDLHRVYKGVMITYKPTRNELKMLESVGKLPDFNTFLDGCKAELVSSLIHTNDETQLRLIQGGVRTLEQLKSIVDTAVKQSR